MQRLERTLVIANGKGGVGKSTVAGQLGVEWAVGRGGKVLVVDLDPQANLTTKDLGVREGDDGKSLLAACLDAVPAPNVIPSGREGLDVIAGGSHTATLSMVMSNDMHGNPLGPARMLHRALAPLTAGYHMTIIDTPPATGSPLSNAALGAGTWLMMPTKSDRGSLDGLVRVLESAADVADGDMIKILGAVLFGIGASATTIRAETRASIEMFAQGHFPVFDSVIRHAEKAAVDARTGAMTPVEYADKAAEAMTWLEALKAGVAEKPQRFSSAARSLADDYRQLVVEIEDRIVELNIHA